jgi:exopolysaccharide biosynthesis polyprenyl glycosylphosphotransferase
MRAQGRPQNNLCADDVPFARFAFPSPATREYSVKRVLLVGTGELAGRAFQAIRRGANPPLVAGVIDSEPQPGWLSRFPDIPLLGGFDDVHAAVLGACVDEIHVALPLKSCFDRIERLEAAGQELGVPVSVHVSVLDRVANLAVTRGPAGVTARCHEHPSSKGMPRLAKRALDLLISSLALLALSPLFAAIAVLIKLTSAGPVFFKQQRIGLGRRQFAMWKFRTMTKNAEELRDRVKSLNNAQGISFKVFRDPRVTRVGALLRRSSLDELPQLINVLLGEMSLVGPRPIPVWVGEQLQGTLYARRFSVPQGITGLWQVEGREQDFDRMAAQDIRYVDMWTLGLDCRILLRTLPAVLRGEGAH